MFILRHIAAWDIGQRWVGVDNTCINELLEGNNMLLEPRILDPATAKGQGRVVVLNVRKKGLSLGVSERDWLRIEILDVMRAIWVLGHIAPKGVVVTCKKVTYFPVEPKVSMAYISPSSIFWAGPPLTMGTLLPA